jgi:hypothetical protein
VVLVLLIKATLVVAVLVHHIIRVQVVAELGE